MASFNQNVPSKVDEENPYWISFSDIMAGLLVIFILATLQLIIELSEQQDKVETAINEVKRANQVKSEILHEVKLALDKAGITVEISDNTAIIHIPRNTLTFPNNSARIPTEQKNDIKIIGEILYTSIVQNNRDQYIDTIFIEGHTDSRRSHYKGTGNWGLSADRAISIWRFWESEQSTQSLWMLNNFRGEKMFSVSGYAATRLLSHHNETEEQHEKNRRIDIRFTMKQPKLIDFENINQILK